MKLKRPARFWRLFSQPAVVIQFLVDASDRREYCLAIREGAPSPVPPARSSRSASSISLTCFAVTFVSPSAASESDESAVESVSGRFAGRLPLSPPRRLFTGGDSPCEESLS